MSFRSRIRIRFFQLKSCQTRESSSQKKLQICHIMNIISLLWLGVFKKTKKPIKPRKSEKNNRKNRTVKKNRLKFWKNRSVWFFKPGTEKTEPNPNPTRKNWKKKQSQNRAKPVWTGFCSKKPNRTETSRFEPVSVFFKIQFGYFFDKNRTEPKMNTPSYGRLEYMEL
jgi:hypothetical protein